MILRVVTLVAWVGLAFAVPTVAHEGVSGFAFDAGRVLVWLACMILALCPDGFVSILLRTLTLAGAFGCLTMARAKIGHPPDAYLAFAVAYVATGLGAILGLPMTGQASDDETEEPGEP